MQLMILHSGEINLFCMATQVLTSYKSQHYRPLCLTIPGKEVCMPFLFNLIPSAVFDCLAVCTVSDRKLDSGTSLVEVK